MINLENLCEKIAKRLDYLKQSSTYILSFFEEIPYLIKWIINRKKDNDYFHDYFVSHKFLHAYFISFSLFIALILTLHFTGAIK